MSGGTPPQTPILNLFLPVVGADRDSWGGYLNANTTEIDDYAEFVNGTLNNLAEQLPRMGAATTDATGTITGTFTIPFANQVAHWQIGNATPPGYTWTMNDLTNEGFSATLSYVGTVVGAGVTVLWFAIGW